MKDSNIRHQWHFSPPPAGSGIWVPLVGQLTSYGQSAYHSYPDFYCPHVIVSGRGVVEVNGERHEVTRGDMFTIWPGQEIRYHDFPETPWLFYYFYLSGNCLGDYVQSLGFSARRPVLRPRKPEAVIALFQNLWRKMASPVSGDQYGILSMIFRLPQLCGQNEPAEKNDDLIENAVTLINSSRNPGRLNVNELCEQLGVTRSTLYRRFMQKLKRSPVACIIAARMKIAHDLVLNTDKTVAEIAALSGFNSEKYFLTLFKRKFDLTPTQFRQKKRAETAGGAAVSAPES